MCLNTTYWRVVYLSHSLPFGYRYPLGNCDSRWIGWAWQPDGYSCTAVAICRLAALLLRRTYPAPEYLGAKRRRGKEKGQGFRGATQRREKKKEEEEKKKI